MDFVTQFKITKEAGSQIKIEGEIPFVELQKERVKAFKHIGKDMEIDGFRKGNIPEKMILAQVGEMAILSEMAERALSLAYPQALKEFKIDALGYPKITITKIAQDTPLGFSLLVATLPEIALPDFKKIAESENKNKESEEVTEAEIETQIKDILRQKLAYERLQGNAQQTHTHEDGTVHEGPEHHHDAKQEEKEVKAVTDADLPELTDAYVQTLGTQGQFATVADFKEKIKEHLAVEKKQDIKAKHRAAITDKIIETASMDLPQILIDSEIEQMFGQMNDDLSRANLKMDDYLGHIKKTKDELKKEWTPAAEKRAKLQLVLNEIAKVEKITPEKAQLDIQVDQLMEQYKDADEMRVRVYVASVMQNEAVMQMLETL